MNILISACLLGINCRYNGVTAKLDGVEKLMEKHNLIPVCPEQLGGLSTPREPSEILVDRVFTKGGQNVTENYNAGADEALKIAKLFSCKYAVLKQRSPSCGCGQVYDGSFSGKIVEGKGVTAELLTKNGVIVLDESQLDLLDNLA